MFAFAEHHVAIEFVCLVPFKAMYSDYDSTLIKPNVCNPKTKQAAKQQEKYEQ